MPHKTQQQLAAALRAASAIVHVGAEYTHYKQPRNRYKVMGLAILEATDEPCVIYQAQYGEHITFVRPVTSWLEEVMWQGQKVQRFTEAD